MQKQTYTITFGGQVENHVGMEKIGEMREHGFTVDELIDTKKEFELEGYDCTLFDLCKCAPKNISAEPASILVIRNGVNAFVDKDELFEEQDSLNWDKKAKQRGRVVNKHARWNLCYATFDQEPDYESGKGRVVSFDNVPLLREVRDYLPSFIGKNAINLFAEGNYYFNVKDCGIGFHGDAERKIVIALRLGASFPLQYQWYQNSCPIGSRAEVILDHGDMYIMSEKATGFDWRKKIVPTLRHAAGADKFLYVKGKPDKIIRV